MQMNYIRYGKATNMKVNKTMWLARDKDGSICLYEQKPIKGDEYFMGGKVEDSDSFIVCESLNPSDFPEVTWENSPIEVELKLKKA